MRLACARVSALHRDRRQFRGSIGSDGFGKVLIGTRGARETFLDGRKGRAAKNSVLTRPWTYGSWTRTYREHPFRKEVHATTLLGPSPTGGSRGSGTA